MEETNHLTTNTESVELPKVRLGKVKSSALATTRLSQTLDTGCDMCKEAVNYRIIRVCGVRHGPPDSDDVPFLLVVKWQGIIAKAGKQERTI